MASPLRVPSLILAILCLSLRTQATSGDAADIPCMKELLPCKPYLETRNPPPQCCVPLLNALRKEAACLCAIFYSANILEALNLTQHEALQLPKSCGGSMPDLGKCATAPASADSSSSNANTGDSKVNADLPLFAGVMVLFHVMLTIF